VSLWPTARATRSPLREPRASIRSAPKLSSLRPLDGYRTGSGRTGNPVDSKHASASRAAPAATEITATHWVADRPLEPRSRELYAMLLRLHIMPWFGDLALDRITPPMVRSWRTDLLRQGRLESTAAKSYRLLRAILNTAG
jgi:hypothetical protein